LASGKSPAGSDAESPDGPPLTPLEAQMRSAAREVRALEAEASKIRGDIAIYQSRIEATPRVEQELAELTKGYDVLVEQYKSYESKAGSARGSQVIEESQKGEQFEVIERAVPPSVPVEPVPMFIYGLGLAGGLILFVGPLIGHAMLHPVIHSEQGLHGLSDIPVLVSIPRIPTPELAKAARRFRLRNIGLSALSAAALAAAVLLVGR
jgi:hypothetical protein